MDLNQILNLSSMPLCSPSYPKGPYRFIDREYFIIIYKSDEKAIKAAVPQPLQPDGSNQVFFEFINMPDSFGFGKYVESGIGIPCIYNGEKVNFVSQMYLDCHPPIVGGREIWGFPKKLGAPKLEITHDTLTGTLKYAEEIIAVGTMQYKHCDLLSTSNNLNNSSVESITKILAKTQVNLKIIPCVTGDLALAQLVGYNITDIKVKGAWKGDARLRLAPHVNAPVSDLPVLEIVQGLHFITDLTLPYGRIIHDYLEK